MKPTIRTITLLLLLLGSAASAQVRVQVNGDQTFVINENNGLYFHNDTMRVDNAIFPLGDIQVITLQPITQGIDSQLSNLNSQISITPNPASDIITLQGIGATPQKATLYSTAGVKLLEQTVSDGSALNISHLPEGFYILRCGNRAAKIVKQL